MKRIKLSSKSISFILLILLCVSGFTQEKPNVLFIAIDDLNDFVGCMNGALKAPTPNIDKLASQGSLFLNAHCQAPICGPSRASIMTGLLPSTSGNYLQLTDEKIKLGSEAAGKATFMPDYFERHGYKTMAVGKIYHQGDKEATFDEYGGLNGGFGPKPEVRLHYDPRKNAGKSGFTQTDWGAFPDRDEQMPDFKSAAWAVDKLQQQHDQPFFLAVGFLRPHVPWHVPQKWFDMFPIDSIKTPPYQADDLDDVPEMARKVAAVPMMPTTEELIASDEWKDVIQAYLACIAFVDAQIGKVLEALNASSYADNTIVVLWSDHGYHLGEKNRFAKQALWERDTRTVLIFKDLAQTGGQQINQPVQLVDIYPTLIDLCKLPPLETLEGHSLTPLIKNPETDWPYPALSFYGVRNAMVRGEQYRLTQYEDGSTELYDLVNDPNEWDNLSDSRGHRRTSRKLKKHIPENWAPLSEHSNYAINPYFQEKSKH